MQHQDLQTNSVLEENRQQVQEIEQSMDHLNINRTLPSNLRIYAVTWNMNGKIPRKSLKKLVECGQDNYDLYVIGLQESPVSSIRTYMQPIIGNQYSLMAKSVLGSLQLYVFGRTCLQPHISAKTVDKIRFPGLGGVVGRQKGAVAVSFCIGESSFLFISSHFSAHGSKLKERNVQYLRTRQKIFSRSEPVLNSCLRNAQTDSQELDKPNAATGSTVDSSDVVIWLGDFNYRIEGSRGLVKSFVKMKLQKLLWRRDQLYNEVGKGKIFEGFVEGPLTFKPTYKYDIGTDKYDTSDKERIPAWTDRILIKVNDHVHVDVSNYCSIDTLKTSDHRPVKATLQISNLK